MKLKNIDLESMMEVRDDTAQCALIFNNRLEKGPIFVAYSLRITGRAKEAKDLEVGSDG